MKITLLKIGAAWCGPCAQLAKRQTLEKFATAHPDVTIEVHDDSETGSKRWENFADTRGVKNIPTLIWLAGGKEILRSEDVSTAGIEKQYRRALKAIS